MGYDGKYGQVTTEHGDIPADEPVIVFRARDALTIRLLAYYKRLCYESGSPQRHVDLVAAARGTFIEWQEANPDQVRVPDSERSRQWMGDASV